MRRLLRAHRELGRGAKHRRRRGSAPCAHCAASPRARTPGPRRAPSDEHAPEGTTPCRATPSPTCPAGGPTTRRASRATDRGAPRTPPRSDHCAPNARSPRSTPERERRARGGELSVLLMGRRMRPRRSARTHVGRKGLTQQQQFVVGYGGGLRRRRDPARLGCCKRADAP